MQLSSREVISLELPQDFATTVTTEGSTQLNAAKERYIVPHLTLVMPKVPTILVITNWYITHLAAVCAVGTPLFPPPLITISLP